MMILILLYIFCLFYSGFSLIIDEKTVAPARWVGHNNNFLRFGFARGGKIEISGTINNPALNAFIYISDQTEYQYRLRQETNWINWLCEDADRALGMRAPLDGNTYQFTVYHKQLYFLSIIDCSDSRWEAHVSAKLFSNDQFNQISLEETELPLTYFVLLILWLVLILVWLIELIGNRNHSSPMYMILFGVLLLKFAVVGIMYFYYWQYSTSGHRYDILSTFQGFLVSISEIALFMGVYLISKGWRINYSGLPAREVRSTVIALIVLVFTLIFFSIYNPDYYWLSLVLMYFLLVPKIFTSISHNINLLDSQILLFEQPQNQAVPTELYLPLLTEKKLMYLRLRNGLLLYLLSVLMVNTLLKILLSWEFQWISKLCDEIIVFLMIGFILLNVRPAKKIFFSSYEEMRPFLNLVEFLQRRGDLELNASELNHRPAQPPWDISKTILIRWPEKRKTAHGKNKKNAAVWKGGVSVTRMKVCLGFEEGYDREERDVL